MSSDVRDSDSGRAAEGSDLLSQPSTVCTNCCARAPELGRPRILVIEDDWHNLELLCEYLEAKGYEVIAARDGAEALAQALAHTPDLIIADIQLPDISGLEVIGRLRATAHLAATPVIALTALAMDGDRERCLLGGADIYMAKPATLRALVAHVAGLLALGAEVGQARAVGG